MSVLPWDYSFPNVFYLFIMSLGHPDNILKCRTLRDFKDCWWNGCSEDWSPTKASKHNIGSHSFDRLKMLIYEEKSKFIWCICIVVFESLQVHSQNKSKAPLLAWKNFSSAETVSELISAFIYDCNRITDNNDRSSHRRYSIKKALLKIFCKIYRKAPLLESYC